ncbi:MAG: glycosyltransferase [Verrucomicrobia bacterium]|nr:glycosyltransferase [Verrucomicrobiota bacterium]
MQNSVYSNPTDANDVIYESINDAFEFGDYSYVAQSGEKSDWRYWVALGLLGKTDDAINGLNEFSNPEACFYKAVSLWMDGRDNDASSLLAKIDTVNARRLLKMISQPKINVLAQTFWDTSCFSDPKFNVKKIGLNAYPFKERSSRICKSALKQIDNREQYDFFFAHMIEWEHLPHDLHELPCPVFGVTSDFDLHIQTIHDWLFVFDHLITVGSEEAWKVRHISRRPSSVFVKMFPLKDKIPNASFSDKITNLYVSGTLFNPYHHDKARLNNLIFESELSDNLFVDGFVGQQLYYEQLKKSKVCYTYVRHGSSMPSRGIDALAMGCAVVVQENSPLSIFASEKEGLFTYNHKTDDLVNVLAHVIDNWKSIKGNLKKGADIVRNEFNHKRCVSQFLRYLTFLAATHNYSRSNRKNASGISQKRAHVRRGRKQPLGVNKDLALDKYSEFKRHEPKDRTLKAYIDTARELEYLVAGDYIEEIARRGGNTVRIEQAQEIVQINELVSNIYNEGTIIYTKSLALRFNQIRHYMYLGKPDNTPWIIEEAKDIVSKPLDHWTLDHLDDIFAWDYFSDSFNYRKYFDIITYGLIKNDIDYTQLKRLILASINYYLGQYTGGLEYLRKAVELDSEFAFYKYTYVQALLISGTEDNNKEAIIMLRELANTSMMFAKAIEMLISPELQRHITPGEYSKYEFKLRNYMNQMYNANDNLKEYLTTTLVEPRSDTDTDTLQTQIKEHEKVGVEENRLTMNSRIPISKRERYADKTILLINMECANWENARSWSYCGGYAFEEGLEWCGANVYKLPATAGGSSNHPASWLSRMKEIGLSRRYDQIWIWMTHVDYTQEFLEKIKELSPVRVGIIMESMEHTNDEYNKYVKCRGRREKILSQLEYMTHALAFDDYDVKTIEKEAGIHAMWCPPVVPWRSVCNEIIMPDPAPAAFYGTVYSSERMKFLSHDGLKGLITKPELLEERTTLPKAFDDHQRKYIEILLGNDMVDNEVFYNYYFGLELIRRRLFDLWMRSIARSYAVVNLPSIFKCYAGRVVETMAAGRPAISWAPPRQRTRSLFEPDNEILLFDRNSPEELAEKIRMLQRDKDLAFNIACNAREKVLNYHTERVRMQQVLDWIDEFEEPDYGEGDYGECKDFCEDDELMDSNRGILDAGIPGNGDNGGGIPNNIRNAQEKIKLESKPIELPEAGKKGRLRDAYGLLSEGRLQMSWQATIEAMRERPFHPEAITVLSRIAHAAGDLEKAKTLVDAAIRMAPGFKLAQDLKKTIKKARSKGSENTKTPWAMIPDEPVFKNIKNTAKSSYVGVLTACIIVRNEEKFIERCISSVKPIAAQIVVVDTGSMDRTVEIARRLGAEVHSYEWNDDFSAARNFSLEKARGDWVLIIDADEELPASEHANIMNNMRELSVLGFRLPIVNAGRNQHGAAYVPRLFRNAPGLFFVGRIHEQVFKSVTVRAREWGLTVGISSAQLVHYGYDADLMKDRKKQERNMNLIKRAVEEDPNDPNIAMNMGLELGRSGRLEECIGWYYKAMQLMTLQPDTRAPELREVMLTQFCGYLANLRRYSEIPEVLGSELARTQEFTASLHYILGLAYFNLGKFSAALEEVETCMAKKNRQTMSPQINEVRGIEPLLIRANCLALLKRYEEAGKAFRVALEHDERSRSARFDYARFLASRRQTGEALRLLIELVSEGAGELPVWDIGARIALTDRRYTAYALDWTAEAVNVFPHERIVIRQRAEALLLNDMPEQAFTWYRKLKYPLDSTSEAGLLVCGFVVDDEEVCSDVKTDRVLNAEFAAWYKRLVQFGARTTIKKLNSRMHAVADILPLTGPLLRNAAAQAQASTVVTDS